MKIPPRVRALLGPTLFPAVGSLGTVPSLALAATTIVVDTSEDLADTTNYDNHTCSYTSGALYYPAPDGKCTLRRAILEASMRPDSDRPITIEFNLSTTDPNYDSTLQVWEIQIDARFPWELERRYITDVGGQVTIDGATQPGGRSTGPKVMIDTNPDNSATGGRSLEIRTSGNTLRNLGFIGGGQIILYEGDNRIENNWMGLKADGSGLSLASDADDQARRSLARGGIILPNEDSDNNVIRGNRIIGAVEAAIRITSGGDNNTIEANYIGMDAQGLVPAPFDAGVDCTRNVDYDPSLWYGGRGIQVRGDGNLIHNNRLVALHIPQSQNDTPPVALEVDGTGNTVTNNAIGRDVAAHNVGVCGQGMLLSGTELLVENNELVHTRNGFDPSDEGTELDSAILTQSFTSGNGRWITVRNNTIIDADQATHPDHAYRFVSPAVPVELRKFNPAKVTSINGTLVTGTQGDDAEVPGSSPISSACPSCRVYLYADDFDGRVEAHELLGQAAADADGNWTATLSRPLRDDEGLRTQSMATADGVIHIYGAGTTTKLSDDLYTSSLPRLVFSQGSYEVDETAGAITIVVQRSGNAANEVSVGYAVVGNSASGGNDYQIDSGTLTFGRGETERTLQIAITDDDQAEGSEYLTLILQDAVGAALGGEAQTQILIVDDESCPPGTTVLEVQGADSYIDEEYFCHASERISAGDLERRGSANELYIDGTSKVIYSSPNIHFHPHFRVMSQGILRAGNGISP